MATHNPNNEESKLGKSETKIDIDYQVSILKSFANINQSWYDFQKAELFFRSCASELDDNEQQRMLAEIVRRYDVQSFAKLDDRTVENMLSLVENQQLGDVRVMASGVQRDFANFLQAKKSQDSALKSFEREQSIAISRIENDIEELDSHVKDLYDRLISIGFKTLIEGFILFVALGVGSYGGIYGIVIIMGIVLFWRFSS